MSDKLVVSTVVSADDYQYFIPLFTYSIKKAYPEWNVKIFLLGQLAEEVKIFLLDNTEVYENMFLDYPMRESTCNALRHLIPAKYFEDFDYVYNTDIDFIIFGHERTHLHYYQKVMKENKLSYAGARGPLKRPKRPKITLRWDGNYKRIGAGCLMLKSPEFYDKTAKARRKYREIVKNGEKQSCEYREYDEVMFCRICAESGLRTPIEKDHFVGGRKMSSKYRDIHLGDFKFRKRYHNEEKMKRILHEENVKKFVELEKDTDWQMRCNSMSQNEKVGKWLGKARKHINSRL